MPRIGDYKKFFPDAIVRSKATLINVIIPPMINGITLREAINHKFFYIKQRGKILETFGYHYTKRKDALKYATNYLNRL